MFAMFDLSCFRCDTVLFFSLYHPNQQFLGTTSTRCGLLCDRSTTQTVSRVYLQFSSLQPSHSPFLSQILPKFGVCIPIMPRRKGWPSPCGKKWPEAGFEKGGRLPWLLLFYERKKAKVKGTQSSSPLLPLIPRKWIQDGQMLPVRFIENDWQKIQQKYK